jgi:hypothetical protein
MAAGAFADRFEAEDATTPRGKAGNSGVSREARNA